MLIVTSTAWLIGWLLSWALNLFNVVGVWISYNGKLLRAWFLYPSSCSLLPSRASSLYLSPPLLSFLTLILWFLTLHSTTPISPSFPLFIGFLSGLVMITLDGFSCRWGPFGLFLIEEGPTLETSVSVLGIATDAECCSAVTSPKALPRHLGAGSKQHQTPRLR